ncbi:MAG: type 4b pilus protein PilO2 [Thermodesulfobacteriota bacterium]
MRRVSIHKKTWAVGLQWYLSNARLGVPELRRLARKEDPNLDLVGFRQRQHAFGASQGDVRAWRGVRALAASVKLATPSFLGLFCLEDDEGSYWWVFALHQALVVGMGDQVFTSRSEADSWIRSLRGLMDEDFEDSVTCETFRESLEWLSPLVPSMPLWIAGKQSGTLLPLQPVPSQRRNQVIAGIVVLLLLSGSYVLKLFLEHQAGKRAVEAARTAMLDKEQRRREIMANPEAHFQRPWLEAPDVAESIRSGIIAILGLPSVASGWVLESATFDGQAVTVAWGHRPGADFTQLPPGARIENPQKAVSRFPAGKVSRLQGAAALIPREDCTRRFYQGTQLMGGRLKLQFHAQEKREIEGIEVISPWQKGQWELVDVPAAVVLDASLPEGFTAMPGLMLSSIIQDKGSWSFKGAIYAVPR